MEYIFCSSQPKYGTYDIWSGGKNLSCYLKNCENETKTVCTDKYLQRKSEKICFVCNLGDEKQLEGGKSTFVNLTCKIPKFVVDSAKTYSGKVLFG